MNDKIPQPLVDYKLSGKSAIVTGASKGIGLAIASGLAQSGVNVLAIARDPSTLEQAAATIRQGSGRCELLSGSVSDQELPTLAVDACMDHFGSVDILINNAGGPPMGTLLEHNLSVWEETIQNNLMSVVRFSKAALPHMVNNNWGRIISISSTVAKEPSPVMILSATARAGVAAFSKALARDVAEKNISVNVICPGGVKTGRMIGLFETAAERQKKSFEDVISAAEQSIPAKRFAEPEEMAAVAMFLCSEQGGYVNGVSLSVDGGLTQAYT